MLKKIFELISVVSFGLLAGCNTMEGFGKDVAKVGDKIEQKADQHK